MFLYKFGLIIFLAGLPMVGFPSLPGDPFKFDMKTCVDQNIKNCLQAVCIPATPPDCPTQCRINAENKCKAISQQEEF